VRLLLDPHVVLWQLSGARSLGARARETIAAAAELAFSVVSFAEIGVKAAVGNLEVPDDLHARILDTGVRVLGLSRRTGSRSRAFRSITAIHSTGCSSLRLSTRGSPW
jgi:PIN domain nuclease of toxin-antitoxin system